MRLNLLEKRVQDLEAHNRAVRVNKLLFPESKPTPAKLARAIKAEVAAEMAKVYEGAAKYQQEVSTNFQKALTKFEGMIAAKNQSISPISPPPVLTARAPVTPIVANPAPALSAPNVIDLVITIPDECD